MALNLDCDLVFGLFLVDANQQGLANPLDFLGGGGDHITPQISVVLGTTLGVGRVGLVKDHLLINLKYRKI